MPRYSRYSESQSTLSEDTDEIVSFWQKYLSGRKKRGARKHRERRWLSSETDTAATSHSAATSAGPRVAGPSRQLAPMSLQLAAVPAGRHGGAGAASCSSEEWDDEGVRWGRSLCVAVLALASALFVGALALSLMRSLPDSWTSRPHRSALQPFVMHAPRTVGKGNTKGVPGRRLLVFNDLVAPNETAEALVEPSPSAETTAVHSPPTDEPTEPAENTTARADGNITAPEVDVSGQQKCGAVFYKFCFKTRPGYHYYSRAANTCLPLGGRGTEVCNRSPNRFASLKSCSRQCTKAREPASKCFEEVLLTGCERGDLVKGSKLWAFDGADCRFWHFPRGQCPSEGDQLFRSLDECSMTCLSRNGTDAPSPCRPPVPQTCSSRQLKYPFFAYTVGAGKRAHCMTTLLAARADNRCLAGANSHPTAAACRDACIPAGSNRH